MKVFVTGGTGAIGGHVIPALINEGHAVSSLARTPDKAAALAKQGATPVSVSVFDRSALTAAVTGHDAIANLATAIPLDRRRRPVDQYPLARANLAAEANANRFSATGGTGIVLRFGWFYGPGAAHSEQMLAMARRHIGSVLGPDTVVRNDR